MSSQRFPAERRLLRSTDFERVRKEGQVVRGKLLSIGYLVSTEDQLRAGFITSRRVGHVTFITTKNAA